MEIDELGDSTTEKAETFLTPQENVDCPELQIEVTECEISALAKRIRRTRNQRSPFGRRKTFFVHKQLVGDQSTEVFNSNEQCSTPSGEKTHISRFQKRQITTIQEEVFQFKKQPRNPFFEALSEDYDKLYEAYQSKKHYRHTLMGVKSKSKAYKEKVASLKLFVDRLRITNLTDPSTLQNNIPDETIQLFEKIHI
ncbi:uncharacterized protein [Parasteatoda tepidariorum]|uniref:uncharacterized protein n=1 Tax=Parasteatoda tepidariorum TaxID=114398 RepID=UPI00077FA409|nr:uncharacterized protein LOC107444151 [Parasteatoda tepidariorum]XP_042902041.1 uncharacterized protein LOC107444151 [Parasteatoda tepidariorum]